MPEFSAEFTNNISQFKDQIAQGLQQVEADLQASGERINKLQIGRELGQSIVDNLRAAGQQAEQEASKIAEAISARLGRAQVGAEKGRGSVAELFQGYGGIGTGGTVAGSLQPLLQQGLGQIQQALREALAGLPPELESARPALQAVGRSAAEQLVETIRGLEAKAVSDLRTALGSQGAQLAGESTLARTGSAYIARNFGSEVGAQALPAEQLARARDGFQHQLEALVGSAQRDAAAALSNVTKGQLVSEANDPNNPNTFYGYPGRQTFNRSDPIQRYDEYGNRVSFEAIPRMSQQEELADARPLTAQSEAANTSKLGDALRREQEAADKAAVAAEQEARVRELFTRALQGQLQPLGGVANPSFFQDKSTGGFLDSRTGLPVTEENDPRQYYRAQAALTTYNSQQQAQAARLQRASASQQNPGPLQAFMGGLTSRGYEAPGTGLVSLFGTTGVLSRYAVSGAAIGALFTGLEQLKTGIVDVQRSQTELNIAEQDAGGVTVNLSKAWNDLAASGVDANAALQIGAQSLIIYQEEIHNSDDATRVFNDTIQNTAILATNTGQELQKASSQLEQATQGFQLGAAGQARINDAVSNARANFGGNSADISQATAAASDVAREGGLNPEQVSNIFSLVNARTGLSASSMASGLERLVSRSGSNQFVQGLNTLNIPNTGNILTEIEQLSAAYQRMDGAQKAAFENQLGGARSIQFLLPLLREGTSLGDANSKSFDGQGRAAQDFQARMGNVLGTLKQLGALMKDVFQNLGRSGLFIGFEGGLALLKPIIEALNSMLATFNRLPSAIRDTVGGLLDLVVAYRLITALRDPNAGRFIPGIRGRGTPPVAEAAAGAEAGAAGAAGAEAGAAGAAAGAEVKAGGAAIAEAETAVSEQQAQLAIAWRELNVELLASMQAQIAAIEASTAEEQAARQAELVVLREGTAQLAATLETAAAEIGAAGATGAAEAGAGAATRGLFGTSLFRGSRLLAGTEEAGFLGHSIGPAATLSRFGANWTEAGAASSLFGRTAGRAGAIGSAALPYGLAALAGLATYSTLNNATNRIQGAEISGNNQLGQNVGASSDDLRTSASQLKQASDNLGKASSGFFGSIMGAIDEGTGVIGNRGAERNLLTSTSKARAQQADAIDKAQQGAGAISSIDLSSTDNLNTALQTLVEKGYSAAQIVQQLTASLNQMNIVAATGVHTFLPTKPGTTGQAGLFSARSSAEIVNGLVSDLGTYVNSAPGNDQETLDRGLGQQALGKIDQSALSKQLLGDIQGEVTKRGYDKSKPVDLQGLEKFAQQDLRDRLKQMGVDYASLPKQVQDILNTNAKFGVADTLKALTGGRQGPTSKQIEDVVDQIIKNAPGIAQNAGVSFQLGGDVSNIPGVNLESSQTAGLLAERNALTGARDQITKTIGTLQKQDPKGQNKAIQSEIQADQQKLEQLLAEIDATNIDVQNALVQDLQTKGDLMVSGRSEFDKSGRLQQQLTTITQQIAKAPADQIPALQTKWNDTRSQLLDQQLADANATRDAAVDPRDALGQKQAALQDALANYQDALKRGATGQDLADRIKAVKQAGVDYSQALIANTNALNDANVSIFDDVGNALAKYQDALNTASGDQSGSTQQKTDLKAAAQDYQAYLQKQVDLANAQASAGAAGRGDVTVAAANLANAQRQLTILKPGQVQYWQTLSQIADDQDQLANAFLQGLSDFQQLHEDITNPVVQAQQAQADAFNKLLADTKRGKDAPTLNADALGYQKAANAEQKATFDQQLQDAQTNYDLHRTSSAQYIQYLRNLRTSITGTTRQAKDERDQIDKAIQDANASMEGQFNLGDIKVPTVYEVRRTVTAAQASQGYSDNRVTSITINGLDSTQAVVNVVKQQLGLNATVTRAPVAVRRA